VVLTYPSNPSSKSYSSTGALPCKSLLDYYLLDFFDEFFSNYFLMKDSFFFDSVVRSKVFLFFYNKANLKDEIFF